MTRKHREIGIRIVFGAAAFVAWAIVGYLVCVKGL